MSRWFRYHVDALNNPKVQKLDGETFKGWVNLLCIAAMHDGKLPPMSDIAFALRTDDNAARTLVERLLNATLIDRLNGGVNGVTYAPHGWDERQYKSDTSTERVKRFRKRSETVTETPPDTDTETDIPLAKANGASANSDKVFWDNAIAYLGAKRRGMVGKWVAQHGRPATAHAITAAQLEGALDPVAYIQGVFRSNGGAGIGI